MAADERNQPGGAPVDDGDELSGLPDPDSPEPEPLGPVESDPGGEGRVHGEEAMPGIPAEGEEPPTDG